MKSYNSLYGSQKDLIKEVSEESNETKVKSNSIGTSQDDEEKDIILTASEGS